MFFVDFDWWQRCSCLLGGESNHEKTQRRAEVMVIVLSV
jgi:hypothetical protein